jgi:hypothetical protein
MITLFYSGATKSQSEQTLPSQSLGGYVSSSRIPNSLRGGVFSLTSEKELFSDTRQTRLIVLQNIGEDTLQNLKFWIESTEDSLFIYKSDAIEPAYDATCNKFYFEQINTEQELPYNADLDIYVEDNKLDLGILESQKYIGIWISREVDVSKLPTVFNPKNNQNISSEEIEYLRNKPSSLTESIILKFSYD